MFRGMRVFSQVLITALAGVALASAQVTFTTAAYNSLRGVKLKLPPEAASGERDRFWLPK